MTDRSKFLCYLDFLGFKSRIAENSFRKGYESIIENLKSGVWGDWVFLISDSVVIISDDFLDLVYKSFSIYSTALEQGLFLRGAVTKGEITEPSTIQLTDNKIVVPYLGKAYLNACELEESLNCAGICVDDVTYKNLLNKEKELIFNYLELFPKDEKKEKKFLVSDMINWSVPQTILLNISQQIDELPKHDFPKFLDTFCLYYKVMKEKT
jgi:hypothetical protein